MSKGIEMYLFKDYLKQKRNGIILFFVFCVIIPLGTLVFKKKNYGDELVKAY